MPAGSKPRRADLDAVARDAATLLTESPHRMSSAEVERLLIRRFDLSRRQARQVIRQLVTAGNLLYTYEQGCSFLEPSFHKPVEVGERVVLVPADKQYQTTGRQVAVYIAPGASFGCGRHPTTRLAIQGIEYALGSVSPPSLLGRSAVLDIGTGSGVLVITAVKLGVGRGVGIDTDPCARVEARQNITHNQLDDRIQISTQPEEDIIPAGRSNIILANLRLPSLLQMADRICRRLTPPGMLVLSGVRVEETTKLLDVYRVHGCHSLWVRKEKGWAAAVCQSSAD